MRSSNQAMFCKIFCNEEYFQQIFDLPQSISGYSQRPPLSAPLHTLPVFRSVLKDGLDVRRCINGVSFFPSYFLKCRCLTQIFSASFYTVLRHAVNINCRLRPLEVSRKAFLDSVGSFYIQVSACARCRRDSRWLTYSSSSLASFMSSCSS